MRPELLLKPSGRRDIGFMTFGANPCQAFFEEHAQAQDKSIELVRLGTAIEFEGLSASPHSPGPVRDDEHVLRLVVNPIHVNSTDGSIKPSLMSDTKSRGASVQRLTHIGRDAVIEVGRAREEEKNAVNAGTAPPRSVYGTVKLSVLDIREVIVASHDRAFGVFDTAKPTDSSHADVFLVISESQAARSARLQLMLLANAGFQLN